MNFFLTPFWKLRPPVTMKNIATSKIHPENSEVDKAVNISDANVEDLKECWQFGAKVLDRIMFIVANTVLLAMFIADIIVPLALYNAHS